MVRISGRPGVLLGLLTGGEALAQPHCGPEVVSVVVFDPHAPVGEGLTMYMSALVGEVEDTDLLGA